MSTCSEQDCTSTKHAKGLCSKHYSQAVRAGQIKPSWRHGNTRTVLNGLSKSGAYKSWQHMKARCYNPNHPGYKYYGGAGVKVCQRWLDSFMNFLEDMGPRPEGYTLDRVEPYDDYEPGNCRWATRRQQALNKKSQYKRKNFIANYSQ